MNPCDDTPVELPSPNVPIDLGARVPGFMPVRLFPLQRVSPGNGFTAFALELGRGVLVVAAADTADDDIAGMIAKAHDAFAPTIEIVLDRQLLIRCSGMEDAHVNWRDSGLVTPAKCVSKRSLRLLVCMVLMDKAGHDLTSGEIIKLLYPDSPTTADVGNELWKRAQGRLAQEIAELRRALHSLLKKHIPGIDLAGVLPKLPKGGSQTPHSLGVTCRIGPGFREALNASIEFDPETGFVWVDVQA